MKPQKKNANPLAISALGALLTLAALAPVQAHERDDDDNDDEDRSYAIGLWGDLPYSPLQASVGVPNLIADMNAQRLKFSVHNGDLKAGSNDKPFLDAAGLRLENFTRVETFGNSATSGNNDVQWLKVTVQPKSREVFSYQAQIVPGNRTAVPPP